MVTWQFIQEYFINCANEVSRELWFYVNDIAQFPSSFVFIVST